MKNYLGLLAKTECQYTLRSLELSRYRCILDKIYQHSKEYMINIRPKLSSERDAKFTDKIEIKAFISLLCLPGPLRSNKKSLEET
jgi:hypothetical protein